MPPEIRVTLPDGSEKRLPAGSSGADLAQAIGPGLAKAALAVRLNGNIRDLARPLPDGAKVTILTDKDPQALEVLRHSSAHVLATAVRQLFPQAKIGFGPPIEDGFYYDFEVQRPFGPGDLEAIEKRMVEVEEAKKRDHRVLGKQLDLFSIQEDVGPGLVFWHPKGAMVQHQLRRFIEDTILERGYSLVYTPNVTREELFLRSGHLPLYAANQFPPMAAGEGESESVRYRVKPMNCPMHILIYA